MQVSIYALTTSSVEAPSILTNPYLRQEPIDHITDNDITEAEYINIMSKHTEQGATQ